MPLYTQDWFEGTGGAAAFEKHLSHLKGKPFLRFLEIGVFEGRSAIWTLDNILTGEDCLLILVDTWRGSAEHPSVRINFKDVKERFLANIEPYRHRVDIIEDTLFGAQIDDWGEKNIIDDLDFIYIDGSHHSADVLRDAVIAWELAKPGAIICFDDYEWNMFRGTTSHPKSGIDAFLAAHEGRYELLEKEYRLWIRKC
jgi:predicted O-methyltransferase YrrM